MDNSCLLLKSSVNLQPDICLMSCIVWPLNVLTTNCFGIERLSPRDFEYTKYGHVVSP